MNRLKVQILLLVVAVPGVPGLSGCPHKPDDGEFEPRLQVLRTAGCILLEEQTQCWGRLRDLYPGAVADDDLTSCTEDAPEFRDCIGYPAEVPDLAGATEIYAGGALMGGNCAAFKAGLVRCWGDFPHLNGADAHAFFETPTEVPEFAHAAAIALDTSHRCVADEGGTLRCWGDNLYGQVGATPSSYADVTHEALGPVVQVSTSERNTCATTKAGEVWCWGENSYGQAGEDGTSEPCWDKVCSPAPTRITNLKNVREVYVSGVPACALTSEGQVMCWGSNEEGNLGDGTGVSSSIPVTVHGLPGKVRALAVGRAYALGAPTCSVVESGAVFCWGGGKVLTLLVPPEKLEWDLGACMCGYAKAPVNLELPTSASSVSIGNVHACAMGQTKSGFEVSCWGEFDPPLKGCGFESGPICTNQF